MESEMYRSKAGVLVSDMYGLLSLYLRVKSLLNLDGADTYLLSSMRAVA